MGQLDQYDLRTQRAEGRNGITEEMIEEEERQLAMIALAKSICDLSKKYGILIIASGFPEVGEVYVTYGTEEKRDTVWYQPENPEKGEK